MLSRVYLQVVGPAIRSVTLMALKTPGMPVLVLYVPLQAPVVAEVLLARVTLEVSANVDTWKPAS